ncbi:hypothetical protein N7523_010292 [Penicillium sp. IBT 18751x]|nr:hypothetical protein N7523_010292 [Penicillium sp. IBT 18751x]
MLHTSLAAPARITNIGGSIAGPPALKTPRPITAARLTSRARNRRLHHLLLVISVLGFDGHLVRERAQGTAWLVFLHLGVAVRMAPSMTDSPTLPNPGDIDHTDARRTSQWPVLIAASLTGVSIDVPIQIPIQQHSTTPMLTGDVLPDQLQPGLLWSVFWSNHVGTSSNPSGWMMMASLVKRSRPVRPLSSA